MSKLNNQDVSKQSLKNIIIINRKSKWLILENQEQMIYTSKDDPFDVTDF